MTVNTPFVISLIALLFYCVLLWIILTREARSRLHVFFSIYLGTMIIWSFGSLMTFANSPLGNTLFWLRMMVMGPYLMPVAFFAFVQVFLMIEWKAVMNLGLLTLLATLVLNFMGLILPQGRLVGSEIDVTYGFPAVVVPALTWVLMIGASAYALIREYRRTRDQIYRNRIKHLLLVLVVIFAGSATNATALKSFPIDITFNIFSALLIANAILRHQLIDINLVVRKGLLYSIPTVLIGSAYFVVTSLSLRYIKASDETQIFLISLIVAILTAVVAQPLRDKAQNWIDKTFYREKYDSWQMLQRVSRTAASVLDLTRLTEMILDEVISTLHLQRAAFFLKRDENGEYVLMTQRGMDGILNLKLARTHPVVSRLAAFGEALSKNDINVLPQFKSLWGQEKEDLERIGAELYIPLKSQGDMVGILAIGPRLSGLSYSEDDIQTLTTLANQTAVAFENARLFSAEQYRREELDSLYSLTRQLIATDDVNDVLDSTTRHVVESVHVQYARLLTQEEDGSFRCRAAYPFRYLDYPVGISKPLTPNVEQIYKKALKQDVAAFINANDEVLNPDDLKALVLVTNHSLAICPLKVGDQAIGLLVLGDETHPSQEPFDADKMRLANAIAGQAASALQRARFHEQMEESFVQTVLALANAADARDTYTNDHSQRMAALAEATCQELGMPESDIRAIHWAAVLHDIGKIGIPDEILRKNGPLDSDEWTIMKRHPEIGAKIVAPVKKLANVAPIIRAHHEKYDGTGYPNGLKGDQIPMGARLLTVVDAYGAMTDDRVYRKSLTHAEAVAELYRCIGSQFDPRIVDAFMRVLDRGIGRKTQPIVYKLEIGGPNLQNKPGESTTRPGSRYGFDHPSSNR
jgi:putative nucleotidyltransferase with HDIG domain